MMKERSVLGWSSSQVMLIESFDSPDAVYTSVCMCVCAHKFDKCGNQYSHRYMHALITS